MSQNGSVSVYPSRSVKATLMATTFTADCSQSRPKSDCYMGYDVAVKGVSVVVHGRLSFLLSNRQIDQSTTSTPTLLFSIPAPCCSSLDPTTKDGALGLPADLRQPDDVLALTGSHPDESFGGFFTSLLEN
jgi:hypothetical protein